MNNKKTRLQRFISSSIAVLLFAAIALGAACDYLCALGREEIAAYESELVSR